jgi:hypothetical protein
MRATFYASLAARRNARPTPVAKYSGFFDARLVFMVLAPLTEATDPSFRKRPTSRPAGDRSPPHPPADIGGKGRLTGAVWAGNDDAARLSFSPSHISFSVIALQTNDFRYGPIMFAVDAQ